MLAKELGGPSAQLSLQLLACAKSAGRGYNWTALVGGRALLTATETQSAPRPQGGNSSANDRHFQIAPKLARFDPSSQAPIKSLPQRQPKACRRTRTNQP
mmetsp:Transcript_14683/g.28447  ORF Transcript_14683/g.28447 Transcript_14683/m.28447 type:complete len:100 (-) Transcript_14683:3-302(-)